MPFLNRPFSGDYPVTNFMDHDGPEGPGNPSGGFQLTWRGQRAIPCADAGGRRPCIGLDSHAGYDWALPMDTPLLAMASGEVLFAGEETPQPCFVHGGALAAGLIVRIGHRAPNGEVFTSAYVHLNRVDVATGDRVTTGQQIGLSGDTGCVSITNGRRDPHLHVAMGRVVNGFLYFTDPYGWDGQGQDPLETNPKGTKSTWLWGPGQAPSLVPPR